MKHILIFLAAFTFSTTAISQTPNWADDVAPILFSNCTKCHNPSGAAPFSLLTYADAQNNGSNIQSAVVSREMPPWHADTSYTRFCDERILSQQEVQTIDDWVNAGMPSGNLSQAPPAPTYSGIAVLSNADHVAQMPAYTVNTPSYDLYRCFVLPTNISTTEYITKVEVIPGNRNIVHHVLVYQDQSNTCVTLDNNDPGPGYTSFGGVGSSTADLVGAWVPGQSVYQLPSNMGIKLLPNTNLIMQVHYPAGIVNGIDSTQVRFVFSSGIVREVYLDPIINHITSLTNGPLYIPANTVQTFHGQAGVSIPATVISVAPHMHLIGTSIYSFVIDPFGDTIPMIRINDWDFHWQGFYNYRMPVKIPYGSQIHAYATYDNTVNNPDNPNASNPQNVYAGEATTNEMMIIYFAYLFYQPGDENIIVDSTLISGQGADYGTIVQTPQLYQPFPSPASHNAQLNVSWYLPYETNLALELVDLAGRSVSIRRSHTHAGFGTDQLSTAGIAPGTYLLKMTAGDILKAKTVVIE
ncbi:MAG TPA: hypothetical protein VI731_00775 [Bacteroidia bacterium]|nr:hypothetical protein [Bacteroidia bacterium]